MTDKIRKRSTRKFAWGCNVWGDTSCPSLAAFPPKPNEGGRLILYGDPGLYDELVRSFLHERDDASGEIVEDLAKEKWLSALFQLESKEIKTYDLERTIAEHRAVAEKLGWLGQERLGAKTRSTG